MFVCFVLMDKAHAQRCLPGMQGLRITGGMVDGFHSAADRNQLGYHFGLSLDTYTKHCNRWVFGAEYLQKYHPYKDIRIPTSQFTAEGGYYYTFLSDANKTFLLSIGVPLLPGTKRIIGERSRSLTVRRCKAMMLSSMAVLYRWNWKAI